MSGINKVILVCTLGQDPEIKYTNSGNAVANVSAATSEKWKDKETGQPQEKTEWHRIVFFNRLAEIVGEYVHKGDKIYIEGKLQTRKWQDQNGQDRYTTEVVVVAPEGTMQMLGSKQSGAQHPQQDGYQQQPPQPQTGYGQPMQQTPRQAPQQQAPHTGYQPQQQAPQQQSRQPHQQQAAPPAMDSFDDDIPF